MTPPDWILPPHLTEADIERSAGFVYEIVEIATQRKYIGRKFTQAKIRGKLRPSTWRRYWGSSADLTAEIKAKGYQAFRRTILSIQPTRSLTIFAETEELFVRRVLTAKLPNGEPEFWNRSILGRWFAQTMQSMETKGKIAAAMAESWRDPDVQTRRAAGVLKAKATWAAKREAKARAAILPDGPQA